MSFPPLYLSFLLPIWLYFHSVKPKTLRVCFSVKISLFKRLFSVRELTGNETREVGDDVQQRSLTRLELGILQLYDSSH